MPLSNEESKEGDIEQGRVDTAASTSGTGAIITLDEEEDYLDCGFEDSDDDYTFDEEDTKVQLPPPKSVQFDLTFTQTSGIPVIDTPPLMRQYVKQLRALNQTLEMQLENAHKAADMWRQRAIAAEKRAHASDCAAAKAKRQLQYTQPLPKPTLEWLGKRQMQQKIVKLVKKLKTVESRVGRRYSQKISTANWLGKKKMLHELSEAKKECAAMKQALEIGQKKAQIISQESTCMVERYKNKLSKIRVATKTLRAQLWVTKAEVYRARSHADWAGRAKMVETLKVMRHEKVQAQEALKKLQQQVKKQKKVQPAKIVKQLCCLPGQVPLILCK